MEICSSNSIRSMDREYIEAFNMPSIVLMENAVIKFLDSIDLTKESFTIISGRGNNGGDALGIARHLLNKGKKIYVHILEKKKCGSEDYQINLNILESLGVEIKNISKVSDIERLEHDIIKSQVIIDGIFGTGLKRVVSGIYSEVIECINRSSKITISIDVPSGVDSDTGEVLGCAVKADKTVTFQVYKKGFLNYKAFEYTGEIETVDIGIPKEIIYKNSDKMRFTDIQYVREKFPLRDKFGHKGTYGKCLVIAGHKGFIGAAYMTTKAAIKSGSGLVTLLTHEDVQSELAIKLNEAMTGRYTFWDEYKNLVESADVIAFGPGMGNDDLTLQKLSEILEVYKGNIVIDADGINALAKDKKLIEKNKGKIVITPHPGEMARLINTSIKEVESNRIEVAKSYAKKNKVVVLLKGYNTVITDGENVFINTTGNSAMASGGMGDTLTGIIASLIGQGLNVFDGAILGAYIHGYIGEELSNNHFSVCATEIIENIPNKMKELISF
ncbi:NAD(P)H-hydrate dehydratase [Clostridium sp. B9]|uniref:NAD(P)H-hydrate dehydratase n=1 Tax=Clostridium sp. B9 TaxID=3423224 RepID=UPI003D2F4841